MPFTKEQGSRAIRLLGLSDPQGSIAQNLKDALLQELGEAEFARILTLANDQMYEGRARYFNTFVPDAPKPAAKDEPAEPARSTPTATPAVQPTDSEDENWKDDPALPGYAISDCLRVKDILGGQGRKKGRVLKPRKEWAKTRKGGFYFRVYFQLTIGGARKKVPVHQIAINRYRLEGKAKYGS